MKPVLAKLAGGDRRRVRGVAEVVARVSVDPALFGDLVEGMLADIAGQASHLRPASVRQLEQLTRTGSPAMKSRGRRLLAKLRR